MGFVCRTLGCGLDTRNLISQADSEDVHARPNGMSDPHYPMPVLAILVILYGWIIRIRHDERVRHLLGEVISLAGTISVCEGEVHRGDHDFRFVESVLPEQGAPSCNFASCGVRDGE